MNINKQLISRLEKAELLNSIKNKAEYNVCLYYHLQTIKEELKEELFNNIAE